MQFHIPCDCHISPHSPSGLGWQAYLHSEGMVPCDSAELILLYSSVHADNFLWLCSQSVCDIMSPAGSPASNWTSLLTRGINSSVFYTFIPREREIITPSVRPRCHAFLYLGDETCKWPPCCRQTTICGVKFGMCLSNREKEHIKRR